MTSGDTTTSGAVAPADPSWVRRLEESREASVRLRKRAIRARLEAAIVMVAVEDARLHREIARHLDAADR